VPLALVFGAAPGFVARVAHAQETPAAGLTLHWNAPEECPKEADVRSRVDALLGRPAATVASLEARAVVMRTAAGYALALETLQGEHRGARSMSDASCVELARAAAAVIALAIDPTISLTEPQSRPAAEFPAVEPAPERALPPLIPVAGAPVAPTAPPTKPPREASPFSAWVGIAAAAELGTLPGFAPGFALGLQGRYRFLLLDVSGLRLPTQYADAPGSDAVGADVDYAGFESRICAANFGEGLSPGVCAGFGVGRLRGVSRGAPTPGSGSVTWITPRLGGLLRYTIGGRFALHAAAQALLPLARVEFTIDYLGPAYEPAPVALLLDAGVAVRFW
jgi:hypothetical protein